MARLSPQRYRLRIALAVLVPLAAVASLSLALSPLRDLLSEPQGPIAGQERVTTGGPATGVEITG